MENLQLTGDSRIGWAMSWNVNDLIVLVTSFAAESKRTPAERVAPGPNTNIVGKLKVFWGLFVMGLDFCSGSL